MGFACLPKMTATMKARVTNAPRLPNALRMCQSYVRRLWRAFSSEVSGHSMPVLAQVSSSAKIGDADEASWRQVQEDILTRYIAYTVAGVVYVYDL